MKTILMSGGRGKLATEILKHNNEYKIHAPIKSEMDITKIDDIRRYVNEVTPDIFLHPAALTRPMIIHDKTPDLSISTNIIGTSNVVLACMEKNIKVVYISTDYVYPGFVGDYKEEDYLLPVNKYAWSKLGGECAVKLYDNSLILRCCISDRPFAHPKAFIDVKKSMIYNTDVAKIILKLLNESGVINVGGKSQTVYDFVKETNPDIQTISIKELGDVELAEDTSMCVNKMKRLLNGK